MAWSGSNRRKRLPKDWPQRRAAVKARAQGMCQAKVHEPDCDGTGSQCDHVIAGDDHRMSNLQWLSSACHRAKTLREARQGRADRPSRTRKPAPSPGLIQDHQKPLTCGNALGADPP